MQMTQEDMEQQELQYLQSKYQVQFSPEQQYQVVIAPKMEKIDLIDTLYNSKLQEKNNLDENYQYTSKSHYEEQKEREEQSKQQQQMDSTNLNASIKDIKKENILLKKVTTEIKKDADSKKQELEELRQQYEQLQQQIKEEKLLHKSLDDQYYEDALKKSYLLTQFQD